MGADLQKFVDNMLNNNVFQQEHPVDPSNPSTEIPNYLNWLEKEMAHVKKEMDAGLVGSPEESMILNNLIGNQMYIADLGEIDPSFLNECIEKYNEVGDLLNLPEALKTGLCKRYVDYMESFIQIGKSLKMESPSSSEEPSGEVKKSSRLVESRPATSSGAGASGDFFSKKSGIKEGFICKKSKEYTGMCRQLFHAGEASNNATSSMAGYGCKKTQELCGTCMQLFYPMEAREGENVFKNKEKEKKEE